jgi:hypothetical protein
MSDEFYTKPETVFLCLQELKKLYFFENEDVAQQVFDAKRLELCGEIYKKLVASLQKISDTQSS